MKTRNETYGSQTKRESKSISKNINGCNSSKTRYAGKDAEKSSLHRPSTIGKTSVRNETMQMNMASLNVRILNSEMVKNSALTTSVKEGDMIDQIGGKVELRERKMKDVLGNIFKYALSATMILSMVLAQGTPKLDIHIEDQKINLSAAEKKDASLISYIPGDTIRYVITASNIGNGLMKNPEIVDPVPTGVTYVAESAKGVDTEISFSMNQGSTYMAWPPYYTVRNSKGILVKREATPDMITHVKWSISKNLNPGDVTSMEFFVVVDK